MTRAGALWAAAALASLPALLLPVSNPDLFWHLSAARHAWRIAAIPRADWLSWTAAGTPWVDFEWLSQASFGAAYAAGGLAGVWVFKAVLLALAGWRVDAWARLYKPAPEWRAAALAAWAAAMLPRADARPELFSVILFAELLRRLEQWRLSRRRPSLWVFGALFALWANLHAGFAYGLAAVALFTVFGLPWPALAAALAGTLVQPWGLDLYRVLLSHMVDAGALAGQISEWKPLDPSNPWRWAELALYASSAAAAIVAARRRRLAAAPALLLAALAAAGLRHVRLSVYGVTLAAPLAAGWAGERPSAGRRSAAAAALIVLFGAWSLRCAWGYGGFRRVFEDRFVPDRAARFLAEERATLGPRPLYNPWGWGGYLGWTIGDEYRVFQDGRYLFHPLLLESARAAESPASWSSFLDRSRVEVALLENIPWMLPSTRRYRDGSERSIPRPYYVFYMPRERWALVHADDKALVFVRRGSVSAPWIQSREIRFLRPHDEAALADAVRTGDVTRAAISQEEQRLKTTQ